MTYKRQIIKKNLDSQIIMKLLIINSELLIVNIINLYKSLSFYEFCILFVYKCNMQKYKVTYSDQ